MMQNRAFQHDAQCLTLHEFTQQLFWAALTQGITSYENASCGMVCGSAHKSSTSAQRVQNPAETPRPALQQAGSAPEAADGQGCSRLLRAVWSWAAQTVQYWLRTNPLRSPFAGSRQSSTPQLITKGTHKRLLTEPSSDEGLSFRWFGPPTWRWTVDTKETFTWN